MIKSGIYLNPRIAILFICLLMINCGELTEELDDSLAFKLEPEFQTISMNNEASISLNVQNLTQPIFAMTMQVNYSSSILSFNDLTGFSVGGFFGSQNVVFVVEENSIIYIAMSIQQGNSEVDGSGTIVTLTFKGSSTGTSEIELSLSDLHFFDSAGNEMSVGDFEIVPAMITVTSLR